MRIFRDGKTRTWIIVLIKVADRPPASDTWNSGIRRTQLQCKIHISFLSIVFQAQCAHHNVMLAVEEVGRVPVQISCVRDSAKITQRERTHPGNRSVGTIPSWASNRSEVHSHTPPFDPLPPSFSPPIVALIAVAVSGIFPVVGMARLTGLGASS